MSYAVMPIKDYQDAGDVIREKTNTEEAIKSGELAAKVEDVYEAGVKDGAEAFEEELLRGAW